MKRLMSLIILLSISLNVFANPFVKVTSKNPDLEYHNHETYEVWYDAAQKNPAFVIWTLTEKEALLAEEAKLKRKSSFDTCGSSATHQDYTKSGYDRGHMCPNNDRDWDQTNMENTFRMCNICHQTHTLNAGIWKTWEERAHDFAKKYGQVTIICGPILSEVQSTIGKGVAVPQRFFKVFIANGKIIGCYIFEQNRDKEYDYTIDDLQKVAGLTFEIKQD